ncbi:MAG: YdcF family protein [Patescibacteria group bacterium]|nr:YdcF family protein [Patescibacteria group bacterium]
MQWKRILFILFLSLPVLTGLGFWQYTHSAYQARIPGSGTAELAAELDSRLPPDRPVAILVPLNGTPTSLDHPSYRNAAVALEIGMRIPKRDRYLILSEGHTGDPCVSGADITLRLLGLKKGYNQAEAITVLLEEEATTTYENIIFSKPILEERFNKTGVSLLVSGMSAPFGSSLPSLLRGDIGHGARAFMLARSIWHAHSAIDPVGFIPANEVDPAIGNYGMRYNFFTMVLASAGVLSLPRFDRNNMRDSGAVCMVH